MVDRKWALIRRTLEILALEEGVWTESLYYDLILAGSVPWNILTSCILDGDISANRLAEVLQELKLRIPVASLGLRSVNMLNSRVPPATLTTRLGISKLRPCPLCGESLLLEDLADLSARLTSTLYRKSINVGVGLSLVSSLPEQVSKDEVEKLMEKVKPAVKTAQSLTWFEPVCTGHYVEWPEWERERVERKGKMRLDELDEAEKSLREALVKAGLQRDMAESIAWIITTTLDVYGSCGLVMTALALSALATTGVDVVESISGIETAIDLVIKPTLSQVAEYLDKCHEQYTGKTFREFIQEVMAYENYLDLAWDETLSKISGSLMPLEH